ncbi:hypothetical protein GOP47_0007969 [Adiantum capillus-veneris]|uniref:Uncharacterized protein n=1 Tax=Adiantum capillus-veneris TaxID=13818 RepID=A0A9D4ZMH1_ADICA|nr:hypothetical protein GOP47_0007969 [Adiantum capillus-veneris]
MRTAARLCMQFVDPLESFLRLRMNPIRCIGGESMWTSASFMGFRLARNGQAGAGLWAFLLCAVCQPCQEESLPFTGTVVASCDAKEEGKVESRAGSQADEEFAEAGCTLAEAPCLQASPCEQGLAAYMAMAMAMGKFLLQHSQQNRR